MGRIPGDGPRLAAGGEAGEVALEAPDARCLERGPEGVVQSHQRSSVERRRAVVDAGQGAAEGIVALREGHPVVRVRLHLHEVAQPDRPHLRGHPREAVVRVPGHARRVANDVPADADPAGRRLARVLQIRVVPRLGVVAELDDLLLAPSGEGLERERGALRDEHRRLHALVVGPGEDRLEAHVAVEDLELALTRLAQAQTRVPGEPTVHAPEHVRPAGDRLVQVDQPAVVLGVVHQAAADLVMAVAQARLAGPA